MSNHFSVLNTVEIKQLWISRNIWAHSWDYGTYRAHSWAHSWDYEPTYEIMVLRIRAVSPEPSLFAHMTYGSGWRIRLKIRHLAPLDGCACVFEEWIYRGQEVPKSRELAYFWFGYWGVERFMQCRSIFYLLPREKISDRTGIGLLSQTFRHDILQNIFY